jgi:phosphoglycolate phosphatase
VGIGMKFDSIIFDLDGTLWDSTEGIVKSWNHILKESDEVNLELTEKDIRGVMGLQIEEIGKRFFPGLSKELQDKLMTDCCEYECDYLNEHGGTLYDGLEDTLKHLSESYNLFIVSNCQCGYIETFFEYHKLGKYFIDYENPGRTGLSKGENIKLVIERNNLRNPVYVGDTAGDCKAARLAGIPFIYASYGFGKVEDYDYKINYLSELLTLLK